MITGTDIYDAPKQDAYFIDFETFDVKPNAAVISMGITSFAWGDTGTQNLLDNGREWLFMIKEQKASGRSFSKDTISWWKSQGEDAKRVFSGSESERMRLENLQPAIMDYLKSYPMAKNAQVFCRGQNFDFPILESICDQYGQSLPWQFWCLRDTRTMIDSYLCNTFGDLKGYKAFMADRYDFVKHNALHDVVMDAFLCDALKTRFLPAIVQLFDPDKDTDCSWANNTTVREEVAWKCVNEHIRMNIA